MKFLQVFHKDLEIVFEPKSLVYVLVIIVFQSHSEKIVSKSREKDLEPFCPKIFPTIQWNFVYKKTQKYSEKHFRAPGYHSSGGTLKLLKYIFFSHNVQNRKNIYFSSLYVPEI